MLYRLGILTACSLILCGCGSNAQLTDATTSTIPIKVRVLLSTGETIGNASNNGCRLTSQEITDIVNQLIGNGGAFGSSTALTWDGVIHEAIIQHSRGEDRAFFIGQVLLTNGVWSAAHLNVYFAGSTSSVSYGGTLDPAVLDQSGDPFSYPFILIDDGGLLGFGANAAVLRSRLTLEHEFCHFVGRLALDNDGVGGTDVGRTFGVGASARAYDKDEHLTSSSGYLMSVGSAVISNIRNLNIPGGETPAVDELGEISTRIRNGLWDNP